LLGDVEHVVIIGTKGTGKSTVEKLLVEEYGFSKAISDTTRAMRKGEVDNVDYHFISDEVFDGRLQNDVYVEHVEARGARYAVARHEIADSRTVFVVDEDGLLQLINSGLKLFIIKLECNIFKRLFRVLKRDGLFNHPIQTIRQFYKDTYDFYMLDDDTWDRINFILDTKHLDQMSVARLISNEYCNKNLITR